MSTTLRELLALAILGSACGDKPDDTAVESDTDTDADSDADGDSDSDSDSDSDTDGGTGLAGFTGAATVTAESYVGTEERWYIGDEGAGSELCRLSLSLSSVAVRGDCESCTWAFDLQVSDAAVVTDDGCLAITGYDASNISELDGTLVSYGYDPAYVGHAEVMMVEEDGEWSVGNYANWDEGSGAFSYDGATGTFAY